MHTLTMIASACIDKCSMSEYNHAWIGMTCTKVKHELGNNVNVARW